MLRNLIVSAAGAGLAVCLVVAGVQFFTTEPLILHAEVFEKAEAVVIAPPADTAPMSMPAATSAVPAGHMHDDGAWEPPDGLERTLYTIAADFVVGVSVSLILLGAMLLKGDPIDARSGLLWGAAGFVAVSLLPGLGLPPELPGTPAADILSRQAWWLATAAVSAAGIFALVYSRQWWVRAAALVAIVAPHVIGAPKPPSFEATHPAGLAGEFVVASIVVSAVLWSLSGLTAGWLYGRVAGQTQA
jgi:cobalt transporter subunit CbtA